MSDVIARREITAEELGRLLGVSARTARGYAEKRIISRTKAGKYRYPDVLHAFFDNLRNEALFGPLRGAGGEL